jgi:TfoX/Sxy family transcriptional regulator of competence genes
MVYNENLAKRVRELLNKQKRVEEKKMMGGLTFMVNGKMCVGILNDELMARINPEIYDSSLKKPGCKEMKFTGRPMKGFVFISPIGAGKRKDLEYWIELALDYNKIAKVSKKKK